MKLYEFSGREYYALIGAESEQEAIGFYQDTISDIKPDDDPPNEITEEEARGKMASAHEKYVQNALEKASLGSKAFVKKAVQIEKSEALAEFEQSIQSSEPYLILVDGTLV